MAEILINLDDISVNLGGRVIFEGLDWEIQNRQRVGLVGPNGAGKSTVMKLISEELEQDAGNIYRKPNLTYARLPQEPEMASGRTILEEAMTSMADLNAVEQRMNKLEAQMGDPDVYENPKKLERVMNAHAKALEEYERMDGPRFASRVKEALTRVGFGPDLWDRPVDVLSGGQKKLVLLAMLIVRQPQLLLLDEPDNHLDVPAKRKLEKLIHHYDGCVVIISHDRYLLDEIATHIAELEGGKLTLYQGNYSAYTTERELRRLRQQQMYAAQQKEIARIEAAIARFELWASIVVDVRHIRQARSRRKMLDKMDKVDKVVESRRMNMDLAGWRGSKKAIELVDVYKDLPDETPIWLGLNMTLWHGERVGLVGPNGAGKSMLFKHIMQPENLEIDGDGEIKIGPSCHIGYYAQEQETLNLDRTPMQEIRNTAPMSEGASVSFLNRYLFTYKQVHEPIRNLSGGERSRLQLAKLVLTKPNLLLLDEPTNNLDINSIEVLEETIENFVGTVLVISHDRYFLDQVVDRIVELREGMLTEFLGGYTDYLDERQLFDV